MTVYRVEIAGRAMLSGWSSDATLFNSRYLSLSLERERGREREREAAVCVCVCVVREEQAHVLVVCDESAVLPRGVRDGLRRVPRRRGRLCQT